ncbi:MAG: FAD-dependent oxidoreductase [Elusimicrobia bacterium]|nr:FAD-dependent oxidoreductase [Candidatus Liberimonas magnetica]
MYDLIILGAGPAGITAGIYAARKRMNFIVISKDLGGQTLWTNNIENYTGYMLVTGRQLVDKFTEQLNLNRIKIQENEIVESAVKGNEGHFSIKTGKANYKTKTVIIATGRAHKKLGIPGEDEFRNKGVAYCATCDAPLFAGKDVAVVGGGNSGLDAVVQLSNVANKVYVIEKEDSFKADPGIMDKVINNSRVEVYRGSTMEEIYGDRFVKGVKIKHGGSRLDISVAGVFVEVGAEPSSDFIKIVNKNDKNEILVDCRSRTSVPGIFAAGDVTDVPAKQIIVACGEGAKASLAAFSYINSAN